MHAAISGALLSGTETRPAGYYKNDPAPNLVRGFCFMERLKSSFDYTFHKLTQKRTLLLAVGVVAILSWVAVFASAKTDQLEVHFFDVGQGDAIFIELPDGRQILIDGGPNDKVVEKLNSVMPFWDRSLDIVIATHGELDHIGGLGSMLEHYDVDVIIWNGIEAQTKIFTEWKQAVDREGAKVLVGEYGMRVAFSDVSFFEILHPRSLAQKAGPSPASESQNNSSLVIRFVYGEDSFLFAGDIERQGEYAILGQNLELTSDILKVAHHGSKTSSSELFIEKVDPKLAVISSGRSNPYGHPHEAILQRFRKYGIEVKRTDEKGDILLVSEGNSF